MSKLKIATQDDAAAPEGQAVPERMALAELHGAAAAAKAAEQELRRRSWRIKGGVHDARRVLDAAREGHKKAQGALGVAMASGEESGSVVVVGLKETVRKSRDAMTDAEDTFAGADAAVAAVQDLLHDAEQEVARCDRRLDEALAAIVGPLEGQLQRLIWRQLEEHKAKTNAMRSFRTDLARDPFAPAPIIQGQGA
jgi:hypothetical protein